MIIHIKTSSLPWGGWRLMYSWMPQWTGDPLFDHPYKMIFYPSVATRKQNDSTRTLGNYTSSINKVVWKYLWLVTLRNNWCFCQDQVSKYANNLLLVKTLMTLMKSQVGDISPNQIFSFYKLEISFHGALKISVSYHALLISSLWNHLRMELLNNIRKFLKHMTLTWE